MTPELPQGIFEEELVLAQKEMLPFLECLKEDGRDKVAGLYISHNSSGRIHNAEGYISLSGAVRYPIVDGKKQPESNASLIFASVSRHELKLDFATMRAERNFAPSQKVIFASGGDMDLFTNDLTRPSIEQLRGIRRALGLCRDWLMTPDHEARMALHEAAKAAYHNKPA